MKRGNANPTDTLTLKGGGFGVLLGSGLGAVAEGFVTEQVLPFDRIDGLAAPTVPGHSGELRQCVVAGRSCLFICGRKHFYEGHADDIRTLLQFLRRAGLTQLLVTSAAGSLVKSVSPGELVLVSDLIDAQFRPPRSAGTLPAGGEPRADRIRQSGNAPEGSGVERPSDSERGRLVLDPAMSRRLWIAASAAKVGLGRGTAVTCAGPVYETPAEIRALQSTGASVVTMSGAPEIEVANALGVRAAMVAIVTNWAAGISSVPLRHDDVLSVARLASTALRQLVVKFVETI